MLSSVSKYLVLFALLTLSASAAQAQSVSRFVVAPYGGSLQGLNHYGAFTVGETASGTHFGTFLTKSGFIQPENWAFVAVEEEQDFEFSIYPNPVTNNLTIEVPAGQADLVQLYDLSGRMVYSNANVQGNQHLVDVAQYADGMYLVRVIGNGELLHESKVIKHSR